MLPKIEDSFDFFVFLKKQNLLENSKYEFWWPNSGSFETVIGAILTQNTRWENVENALENLKNSNMINLESLANCDSNILESLIFKCGFFRQKSQRLKNLSKNILEDFGSFDEFRDSVTREWLLSQKGIGFETADCILNYACYLEIMVVDKYTQNLLNKFGFEFESYEDIQSWLQQGIIQNYNEIEKFYTKNVSLAKVYARFHGKIVEYSKLKSKGK